MKKYLVLGAVLALGGCAEISSFVSTATVSAAAAETVANTNIENADKVKAKTAADQFCTMTVATLAANPQWVKPVQDLCWAGQVTTPSAAAVISIPTKAAAAAQ